MPLPLPPATIRTQVSVSLKFADGDITAARVFYFDGLVDGQENQGRTSRSAWSTATASCPSVASARRRRM